MLIDFKANIKGVRYIVAIKWGLFKSEVKIYEEVTKTRCIVPEYKIIKASTIWDWLKFVAKKPYRKIIGVYFKYFAD